MKCTAIYALAAATMIDSPKVLQAGDQKAFSPSVIDIGDQLYSVRQIASTTVGTFPDRGNITYETQQRFYV